MTKNLETRATRLSNELAEAIWTQFHEQLAREASKQLYLRQITADASDLVVSAMGSFFRRFDDFSIENDNAMWGLLKQILLRKISAMVRRSSALKRGRTVNEADVGAEFCIDQIEFQRGLPSLIQECIDLLLDLEQKSTHDQTDKQIVDLLQQGFNNKQIASHLGISTFRLKQRLTSLCHRFQVGLDAKRFD